MSTARRDKTDEWDARKPVTEPKRGTCEDYKIPHVRNNHGQLAVPFTCVNWREGERAATQPGCDKCGHLIGYHAAGNPEGKCTICGCGCDNYYKDGKPMYETVPPAAETACKCDVCVDRRENAETAMTAEQLANDYARLLEQGQYGAWTSYSAVRAALKACAESYAAHVREAAQGEIDLQPLKDVCERQWAKETPRQVIAIAANAIYWRGENIKEYAARFVQANERAETAERKLADQDDQIAALKELVERYLGKLAELEKAMCKVGDIAVAALASLRAESKEG